MPSIAAQYNDQMGAVDIGDQLRASEGFDHRVHKGNWRVIAWKFLLETSLVNSFLLQRFKDPAWGSIRRQVDWRQRLVDELLEAYAGDGTSRQLFRAGDTFTPRLQHNHVDRKKSSKCLACQGFRAGEIRSRSHRKPLQVRDPNARAPTKTRRGCDVCDVAICTSENCWYFYHSLVPT